jgi:hypothetical protein
MAAAAALKSKGSGDGSDDRGGGGSGPNCGLSLLLQLFALHSSLLPDDSAFSFSRRIMSARYSNEYGTPDVSDEDNIPSFSRLIVSDEASSSFPPTDRG